MHLKDIFVISASIKSVKLVQIKSHTIRLLLLLRYSLKFQQIIHLYQIQSHYQTHCQFHHQMNLDLNHH